MAMTLLRNFGWSYISGIPRAAHTLHTAHTPYRNFLCRFVTRLRQPESKEKERGGEGRSLAWHNIISPQSSSAMCHTICYCPYERIMLRSVSPHFQRRPHITCIHKLCYYRIPSPSIYIIQPNGGAHIHIYIYIYT